MGDGTRQFTYARYDPDISKQGLAELQLGDIDPAAVAQLDSIAAMDDLLRIGRTYAARHLKAGAHFGAFWPSLGG